MTTEWKNNDQTYLGDGGAQVAVRPHKLKVGVSLDLQTPRPGSQHQNELAQRRRWDQHKVGVALNSTIRRDARRDAQQRQATAATGRHQQQRAQQQRGEQWRGLSAAGAAAEVAGGRMPAASAAASSGERRQHPRCACLVQEPLQVCVADAKLGARQAGGHIGVHLAGGKGRGESEAGTRTHTHGNM